jgi:hypothetical protein
MSSPAGVIDGGLGQLDRLHLVVPAHLGQRVQREQHPLVQVASIAVRGPAAAEDLGAEALQPEPDEHRVVGGGSGDAVEREGDPRFGHPCIGGKPACELRRV